nr:MAG TPA: hypothetical protein [Caudoviricetes sp.]
MNAFAFCRDRSHPRTDETGVYKVGTFHILKLQQCTHSSRGNPRGRTGMPTRSARSRSHDSHIKCQAYRTPAPL